MARAIARWGVDGCRATRLGRSGRKLGFHELDATLRHAEAHGRPASSIIDRPDAVDRLAGSTQVRTHLIRGDPVADLPASFAADHAAFRSLSADALLYPTD